MRMTAVQLLLWSVAGPLLFLAALYGQLLYRFTVPPAADISVPAWPASVPPAERQQLLAARLTLLDRFKLLLAGRAGLEQLQQLLTEDCRFEDPTQLLIGREEIALLLLDLSPRYVEDIEFEVHAVHHAPHLLLVDWTLNIQTKVFGLNLALPMRTHLYLEGEGGGEQVFRIKEEWWGKELLNPRTTLRVLGDLHNQLRRFNGYLLVKGIQSGYV